MNITITVPIDWLRDVHPQFELLRHEDSTVRRMVVELTVATAARHAAGNLDLDFDAVDGAASAFDERVRVMAYIPDATSRTVATIARMNSSTPANTVKALLCALWLARPQDVRRVSAVSSPMAMLLSKMPGREVRPEQVTAFSCMEDALTTGRVGMVEASTGVGKALAAMHAAVRWTKASAAPIVIAAPTLALVRQLAAEYRAIKAVDDVPGCAAIFGRREFVSAANLSELLAAKSEFDTDKVRAWVVRGGRAVDADDVEPAWLIDSLVLEHPEVPVDEVRMGDIAAPGDAGLQAYRAQFKGPTTPDGGSAAHVVICSHAMLAQDMRMRMRSASRDADFVATNKDVLALYKQMRGLKAGDDLLNEKKERLDELRSALTDAFGAQNVVGLLPKFGALIVDEAQQLEEAFSNAFSEYLSLNKLRQQLFDYRAQGGQISQTVVNSVNAAIVGMTASVAGRAGSMSDLTPLAATDLTVARLRLTEIRDALIPVAAKKITHQTPALRAVALIQIKRAVGLLRLALNGGLGRSYLRFSPTRAYPQLYVGQSSVESLLQMLWSSVQSGVALSATLYLYRADGPSADYMRGLLGIPSERLAVYPPIHAPWLVKPIHSVDVPVGARGAKLRPPTRMDKLAPEEHKRKFEAWLDNLAQELRTIYASAAGGVLVLNTSYEMAHGLARRFKEAAPHGAEMVDVDCLVEAKDGFSLATQATRFLSVQASGGKPLWLAVGGAWTGLDIGGHEPRTRLLGLDQIPADLDNVLTDLVIPRLPFGTNNSITHKRRIATRPSMPWDLLDAAFRFRQALGRLVRRMGLPGNRRIFILDGRLSEPAARGGLSVFWTAIDRVRGRSVPRASGG